MFIPKPFKKWIKILRGKVSPVMIVLSVALGFWFGLMPTWTGFNTAILLIVLILNVHIGLFLIFAALGKAFCFAAAPALYHTGLFVQEHLPILIRIFSHIPVVAMTDFCRISVVGAMLLGPVIGVIPGLLLAGTVVQFRKQWFKLESNSEAFKKWYSKKWVRLLDRILVGKSAKDAKSALEGKGPIIRMPGVVLAVIIAIILIVVSFMIPDEKITQKASTELSQANGAEVNIAQLQVTPLAGKFSASGVQMTNPEKPTHNKIAVDKVTADADIMGFLMGKIVLDDIELTNLKFDIQRDSPGQVIERPKQEGPSMSDRIKDIDAARMEEYVAKAKQIKDMLSNLAKYLPNSKEKPPATPREIPDEYLEYLEAKTQLPPAARMIAKRISFDNIEIPVDFLGKSQVLIKNLNDAPRASGLPITLEARSQETEASFKVEYDASATGDKPNVTGAFDDFDLQQLADLMGRKAMLDFAGGKASGKIKGTMLANFMDLAFDVNIRDMQVSDKSKGLLGLDGETTAAILDKMQNMDLTVRMVGDPASPGIVLENAAIMEEIKQAAMEAGKEKVLKEVDKKIQEQVGDKVPGEMKETITEGIKGLFGGEKE